MTPGAVRPVHAADAAFTQFIASLWREAQAAGLDEGSEQMDQRDADDGHRELDLQHARIDMA